MTSLQAWLSKPRATVRVDRTVPWAAWMKVLRRPFSREHADTRPRIEILDRLSLGGKKSLLLIAIEGRRLLVGVGEDAAPSISVFEGMTRSTSSRPSSRSPRIFRGRRMSRP
jgi:flagellar biogenesis protein FliO